jgi:translocation and assembly module TamA
LVRALIVCSTLLLAHLASATAVKIRIEGVEGELEAAVRNALDLQRYLARDISAQQVERLYRKVESQAVGALHPYGYYHARVETDLNRSGDAFEVIVRVTPGEPVKVTDLQVAVDGTANQVPAVQKTLQAFRPKVGDRLEHSLYEDSKTNVSTALQANGYFDAETERTRVEVLSSANTATIDVAWKSGERYRYGEVHFPDTQLAATFIRRYIPWKPDDYYSSDDVLKLQQRLVDGDYFSGVSVQPDLERKAGGAVPIDVLLVPGKRTVYKTGVYASTDKGPGAHVGMERRWLNEWGHKAGVELEYATRLQAASTYYRIPKPGARNRNLNLAAGYSDEETDSSQTRSAKVSVSEVLTDWHGYTRTLGLQYLNGDFEIADEQSSSSLLYAGAQLTRKRADDLSNPRRGVGVIYGLRLANEGPLSDTTLAQIRADAKWIRPVSRQSRLILRASLGAMAVDDFDALPPELRFFAGGDRSLRGFDYQQIGETNEAGGVIGGKYLTVASTEYEYYFMPKWGAAIFVDAGDAYSDTFNTNIGAGIGVRWRSPVGIVRLDFALPVKTNLDDDGFRVHIVIGPDL